MNDRNASISAQNKLIARYVANVFGGSPRVHEYADRAERLTVGILYCHDKPRAGVTSHSTIRLSDHPMLWGDGEFPTRLELAGVCLREAERFPNILASAAFTIMKSDAVYHPGTVMPEAVRRYYPDSRLPHLYLSSPFLWQPELRTMDCGTKRVSWLLAVPISEPEYSYLRTQGERALDHQLESQNVDIADLNRLSTL